MHSSLIGGFEAFMLNQKAFSDLISLTTGIPTCSVLPLCLPRRVVPIMNSSKLTVKVDRLAAESPIFVW